VAISTWWRLSNSSRIVVSVVVSLLPLPHVYRELLEPASIDRVLLSDLFVRHYILLQNFYKIKQAFKQAKQASFRCEKSQASKLRLSGLACLLNSNSTYTTTKKIEYSEATTSSSLQLQRLCTKGITLKLELKVRSGETPRNMSLYNLLWEIKGRNNFTNCDNEADDDVPSLKKILRPISR